MLFDVLVGLLMIVVMVLSSGVAVSVFEKIVHEIKVSKLVLATLLVGFSTSLPELFVGIVAAVNNQSQLALGDIVGANIANMSWIIGGAALMAGSIPVVGGYISKDFWLSAIAAVTPFVLMIDGRLDRLDALFLVLIYIFYTRDLIVSGKSPLRHLHMSGKSHVIHHRLKTRIRWAEEVMKLILALGLLIFSSWMLVQIAIKLTVLVGVSQFWIGLLVVAIGTTLPELALSLTASKRREVSLLLGNVLGSVVVNSTLILGVVALVRPIEYKQTLSTGMSGVFLIAMLGLFWLFTRTKHRLDRWEGMALVGFYAMFVGLQFMLA